MNYCGSPARIPKVFVLAMVLTLACAACGSDSSRNPPPPSPPAPVPRFQAGACPSSVASLPALANAECGRLVVPENRQENNGKTVQLPVAIIPSIMQPPTQPPIFHFAGGPGGDALGDAEFLVPAGLNQDRDLIIMGQRGTLDTEPQLTCPEIDEFNARSVGLVYDAPSTGVEHVAATKACRDRLAAEGVDLSAYNTTENMDDFLDLRKVLHITDWSIYSYSYGTYLALTIMREHPEGIQSVVLDSVVPPGVASLGWTWSNLGEAFNNLFDACAAQSACASKYGDLRSVFTSEVQQLEAHPLTTTGTYSPSVPPFKVVLDGGALVNWLVAAGPDFTKVPSAIYQLAQGNPAQIANGRAALAQPCDSFPAVPCKSTFGYGLTYGVFCSEWVPFEPQSEILAKGLLVFPTYPHSVLRQAPQLPFETEDCAVWDVPAAPPSIREVTTSDIPTLIVAGSFDAKTSPMWAKYAARTLPNSTTIVIPGVGHWATPQSPCAQKVVASFLADPNLPPDTSCVSKLTPPPFR